MNPISDVFKTPNDLRNRVPWGPGTPQPPAPAANLPAIAPIAHFQPEGLPIKYVANGNGYVEQGPTRWKGIVMHHTAGPTFDGALSVLQKGDANRGMQKFGYHFYVDRDGSIYQGAPLTSRTAHVAGSARRGRHDIQNNTALGVSFVGSGQETPAQLAAGQRLVEALQKQYGIKTEDIVGHGEVQFGRMPTEGMALVNAMRKGQRLDPGLSPAPNVNVAQAPVPNPPMDPRWQVDLKPTAPMPPVADNDILRAAPARPVVADRKPAAPENILREQVFDHIENIAPRVPMQANALAAPQVANTDDVLKKLPLPEAPSGLNMAGVTMPQPVQVAEVPQAPAPVGENAPMSAPQNFPGFTINANAPMSAPAGNDAAMFNALIAGLAKQPQRAQVIMPQIQPLAMNKPRLDITRPV